MAFTEPWSSEYESRPSVDEFLDQTLQPTLTGTKRNVRERMELEHYWGVGDGDGVHKFLSGPTSVRPVGLAGQIFFNGDRWTQEFNTGTAWTNLSFLPGDILVCMNVSSTPAGWVLVTFTADRALRLVNTNVGFATGGSWAISGLASSSAGAQTLTGTFTTEVNDLNEAVENGAGSGVADSGHVHDVDVTLNVSNHTHSITQNGEWRPAYVDCFAIQKN